MKNLLRETLEMLVVSGKSERDILFCTCRDEYFSFGKFKELAANIDYDSGYGGAEIRDIYIVGKDWWLERGEYDGSEWWEFKTIPVKPEKETFCPELTRER